MSPYNYAEQCPVCLEPIDYCLGHGILPDGKCEICGETFRDHDDRAEMFDPDAPLPHKLVHHLCGSDAGLELA